MAKKKKSSVVAEGTTICTSQCPHCVYGSLSSDKKRVICSLDNKIYVYGKKVNCRK